jgi:D-alanine transaminase
VYGDGLYDVAKVLAGRALLLGEHLDRLRRGLATVEIPLTVDLEKVCREVLAASAVVDGSLYLQVSRGAGPRTHIPPVDLEPTVLVVPMSHPHPGEEALEEGLAAVTFEDLRWGRCDLKTTSLMGTVLGKLAARREAVTEVLFLSSEGRLREGGSTSLFVVREGRLETHPLDRHILPSITRQVVLRLAGELGIGVEEAAPRLAERGEWEEALLCGTLTTVRGLTVLNGTPVAQGRVGPVTRSLIAAYREFELEAAEAVEAHTEP